MKRPSCKWKGQTVADDRSTGGAGSPISRMPQSTKGGLRPTHQPTSESLSPSLKRKSDTVSKHCQGKPMAEATIRQHFKIRPVIAPNNVRTYLTPKRKLFIAKMQEMEQWTQNLGSIHIQRIRQKKKEWIVKHYLGIIIDPSHHRYPKAFPPLW